MSKARVAITAASSFTGYWIARVFAEHGWEIEGLCSGDEQGYTGLRKFRVDSLHGKIPLHFGARAEDETMAEWIEKNRPEVWIHHHHYMDDFRSTGYDYPKAMRLCVDPLPEIVRTLKKAGTRGVIFSGSYFERGEGNLDPSAEPLPYPKSKSEVWRRLKELCDEALIPVSKIIIPNPVGPFENPDRLTPTLLKKAMAGEAIELHAPDMLADNYPAPELGRDYIQSAQDLLRGQTSVIRPSGMVCSTLEWVKLVNEELILKRMGKARCHITEAPVPPGRKHGFQNREPRAVNWPAFWDLYAAELQKLESAVSL